MDSKPLVVPGDQNESSDLLSGFHAPVFSSMWAWKSLAIYQLFGAFTMFLIYYLALSVIFIEIVGPNNSTCHYQASYLSCNQIIRTQNPSALQYVLHLHSPETILLRYKGGWGDAGRGDRNGNCQQE